MWNFRASLTLAGSSLSSPRKSIWWAPSGMMITSTLSLNDRKIPKIKTSLQLNFKRYVFLTSSWPRIKKTVRKYDIWSSFKSFSSVLRDCGIFTRKNLEFFVTAVRVFFEVPFTWQEHISRSVWTHRHHHFCTRLKIPAQASQRRIIGSWCISAIHFSRVICVNLQSFAKGWD